MTATAPMRIVALRARNVLRLRAIEIHPDEHGNMVVLTGKNGQGKSSVLNAIQIALGGKRNMPPEPLRRGAADGEIVVDLGEIVVRRTLTANGDDQLVVESRDGARFARPQEILNKLVGELAFDPLAFKSAPPKEQAETLRRLLRLDFTDHDSERQTLYEERTAVNRQVAQLKARLDTQPHHEDAPADPIDVAELGRQLQEAQAAKDAKTRAARLVYEAEVSRKEARARVDRLRVDLEAAEEALDRCENAYARLSAESAALPTVDAAPLHEQLRTAEATNAKVRANHARQVLAASLGETQKESEDLTAAIAELDRKKADAIAAAPMPVPGLGFSAAGGVTMNGLPFEQASGAEQLRVSVAIAIATNPRLRVMLVRDASLLDSDSMRLVAGMADASGTQLWLEAVESDDPAAVVIVDGMVEGAEQPAAEEASSQLDGPGV